MSLRTALKRQGTVRGRRWIVKKDSDGFVREVKLIFNPQEYELQKRAKPMLGDRALIKILDSDKTEREKKRLVGEA